MTFRRCRKFMLKTLKLIGRKLVLYLPGKIKNLILHKMIYLRGRNHRKTNYKAFNFRCIKVFKI